MKSGLLFAMKRLDALRPSLSPAQHWRVRSAADVEYETMQRFFRIDRQPETIPTDTTRPRVLVRWPKLGTIEAIHFDDQRSAYAYWLGLPRDIRAAMRNAGETLPVRSHDFVTA